jgi:hypothetical protein
MRLPVCPHRTVIMTPRSSRCKMPGYSAFKDGRRQTDHGRRDTGRTKIGLRLAARRAGAAPASGPIGACGMPPACVPMNGRAPSSHREDPGDQERQAVLEMGGQVTPGGVKDERDHHGLRDAGRRVVATVSRLHVVDGWVFFSGGSQRTTSPWKSWRRQ